MSKRKSIRKTFSGKSVDKFQKSLSNVGRLNNECLECDNYSASNNDAFLTHEFKKSLGQNFIRDKNLLSAMVQDAEVTNEDRVLEIGAGAGTLTEILCRNAKSVVAIEVDESLRPILEEKVEQNRNLEVIFADIMKCDISEINAKILGEDEQSAGDNHIKYKVVANLPYYITTPILFKLLENFEYISSISIMVQKEVAERVISNETSGDYGVLSIMVKYFGSAKIARNVGRHNFFPVPKVDSAILKIDIFEDIDKILLPKFRTLVKCAFSSRRKTLINNLKKGYNYTGLQLEEKLLSIGVSVKARGEDLSFEEFVELAKLL